MNQEVVYYGKITTVGGSEGLTIPKLIMDTHKFKRGDTLQVIIKKVGQ